MLAVAPHLCAEPVACIALTRSAVQSLLHCGAVQILAGSCGSPHPAAFSVQCRLLAEVLYLLLLMMRLLPDWVSMRPAT